MAEYVDFSDKMGLPQQIDRINGDGLKGVNKSAKLKSAFENGIIKVQKTKKTGYPNTVTQIENKNGGITRNYYDEKGLWSKQITNNNHGNNKNHPYGKNGEHAHDIVWKDNEIIGRKVRELTDKEREENKDIL